MTEILYDYFKEHLYYDETSPSGLRWLSDRYGGKTFKTLARKKDDVAGSKKCGKDFEKNKYWQVTLDRKVWPVHRIVWCLCNKSDVPDDLVIDHVDRDGFNNKIENLRLVTQAVNMVNVDRERLVSAHKNIVWQELRKRWRVYHFINGKQVNKTFNPRTMYPYLSEQEGKDRCELDAILYARYVDDLRFSGKLTEPKLPDIMQVLNLLKEYKDD